MCCVKITLLKHKCRVAHLLLGSIVVTLCQLLCVYVVQLEQPVNCPSERFHAEGMDYVLSLSYYDQITSAAMRVASLQCWTNQHGMAVVEPFVNYTYLGMPPTDGYNFPTLKKSLRFRDLFDIDRWNVEGRQILGCFSPLVKWEDFIRNAPREIVAVQIIYAGNERHQKPCTFPRLMKYWSFYLKPHGFKITKYICLDMRNLGWLTDEEFSSKVMNKGSTLIFEQWRGIAIKKMKTWKNYITLKHSSCTNEKGRTVIWNSLNPSSTVRYHAQEYLKCHLKGGNSFLTVMLRVEYILLRKDYYSIARCRDRVESLVKEIKERHNLNAVFLTTDIGDYGSQEMPEYIGSQRATEYIESLLSAVHSKPTTLKEHQHTFERIVSQYDSHKYDHYSTSAAYVSTLQKAIASQASCMLIIGGGFYQDHAKEWYYKLNNFISQGLCIQQYNRC